MEREATIRISALEKEIAALKKVVKKLQSVMLIAENDMKEEGIKKADLVKS